PSDFVLTADNPIIHFDIWGALHLRQLADHFFVDNGLLRELTLDPGTALGSKDLELLHFIEASASAVAIHVRRGDYATHDGGLLLSADYYNNAIGKMEAQLPGADFFCFSDDIAWCKEHLKAS